MVDITKKDWFQKKKAAHEEEAERQAQTQPVKTEPEPEPKKDSYTDSVAYQVLSKPVQIEEARAVSTRQSDLGGIPSQAEQQAIYDRLNDPSRTDVKTVSLRQGEAYDSRTGIITPRDTRPITAIRQHIPMLESKQKYGYVPDDPDYRRERDKLTRLIIDAQTERKLEQDFLTAYPDMDTQVKKDISDIKSLPEETMVWVDINEDKIQDPGELFSKTAALSKFTFSEEDTASIKALPDKPSVWIDINQDMIQDPGEVFSKEQALEIKQQELSDLDISRTTISDNIAKLTNAITNLKTKTQLLSSYETAGYKLDVTPSGGWQFVSPTAKEISKSIHGEGSAARLTAVSMMNLGIPTIVAGATSLITGDKSYGESEIERLSRVSLGLTKTSGEPIITPGDIKWVIPPVAIASEYLGGKSGSYTSRFWSSPEAIESTWLPLATLGAGYTVKSLSIGSKVAGVTKTSVIGGKVIKGGMYAATGVGVTLTGVHLGMTAAQDPKQLPSQIGKVAFLWGISYAGFKSGQYLAERHVPIPRMIDGKLRMDIRSEYGQTYVKKVDNLSYSLYDKASGHRITTTRPTPRLHEFYHTGQINVGGKQYFVDMHGFGQRYGDIINLSKATGIVQPSQPSGFWVKTTTGHVFDIKGGSLTFAKGGTLQFDFSKALVKFRDPFLAIQGMKETGFTMSYKDIGQFIQNVKVKYTHISDALYTSKVKPALFDAAAYEHIGVYETDISKGFYVEKGGIHIFKHFVKSGIPYVQGDPTKASSLKGLNDLTAFLNKPPSVPNIGITGVSSSVITQTGGSISAVKGVSGLKPLGDLVHTVATGQATAPATGVGFPPMLFMGSSYASVTGQYKNLQDIGQKTGAIQILKPMQMNITDKVLQFKQEIVQDDVLRSLIDTSTRHISTERSMLGTVQGQEGLVDVFKSSAMGMDQLQKTSVLQKNILKSILKTTPVVTPATVPVSFVTTVPFMGLWFPKIPIVGMGGKQPGWELWEKTKKYRERETFDPFNVTFEDMNLSKKKLKQLGGF